MTRAADIEEFYSLVGRLTDRLGGRMHLSNLNDRKWPKRGVYFFFDDREQRRDSGDGPRIVRVGTHALNTGSQSSLRQRLSQHRGGSSGGGNHRSSIFRLLVGQALIARGEISTCPSWGVKGDAHKASAVLAIDRRALATAERPVEEAVSAYLARLTFTRLTIEDEPGLGSWRGLIERNSIALLSNLQRSPVDPPSLNWLGLSSDRSLVAGSGLWNQRHVAESHNPAFLDILSQLVEQEGSA